LSLQKTSQQAQQVHQFSQHLNQVAVLTNQEIQQGKEQLDAVAAIPEMLATVQQSCWNAQRPVWLRLRHSNQASMVLNDPNRQYRIWIRSIAACSKRYQW
jgi:hypothetical protein